MGEGVKTARILWTSFMDGPLVSRVKNFGENSRGVSPSTKLPNTSGYMKLAIFYQYLAVSVSVLIWCIVADL